MILYVDETECDDYFIVAGMLVESHGDVEYAFKRFKKKINYINLSPKEKGKIYVEFKATMLDKHYQSIKKTMMNVICELCPKIYFSTYQKGKMKFKQHIKQKA